MTEWRDIPGYEGHYQVNSYGQVKSVERHYVNIAGQQRAIRERILRPGDGDYPSVVLRAPDGASRRTWKLHQLVAPAFHGPAPFPGAEVCHGDGNPLNNRADNLRWDTRSANGIDSVQHGNNAGALKTHCPSGHEYTPDNTILYGPRRTRRRCRACQSIHNKRYHARKKTA